MESAGSDTNARGPGALEKVRRYYESRDYVRRGICLLNARCYEEAVEAFSAGLKLHPGSANLSEYLARSYIGCGDYRAAAEQMSELADHDPQDATSRIRQAMLLWKNGEPKGAIASLRSAIGADPECAELHFQLGVLLGSMDEPREAEMRFTAALSIDGRHVEAMVSLAMCHGAREEPGRAAAYLRQAQSLQPHNARIGLLLAHASRAANDAGATGAAVMPPAEPDKAEEVAALSDIIQQDPEFLDTFLDLAPGELDTNEEFYQLLARTVDHAVKHQPDRAELRYHYARVLDRLGRPEDAIESVECALTIRPGYIRALIESAKLYHKTHRLADATDRLEETVRRGAEYADVYLLLGDVYRDRGQADRARKAYRQALSINEDYVEAQTALEELPT